MNRARDAIRNIARGLLWLAIVLAGTAAVVGLFVACVSAPMWLLNQVLRDFDGVLVRLLYLAAAVGGFMVALWALAKITDSRLF